MENQILVVDDHPLVLTTLDRYLTENGYGVRVAQDGNEMRRVLAEHSIDLIILDLMLPGESGLDLAREVLQASRIPIIFLSAKGDDIDRIVGLELGADDYITKPYNPRELLARIRSVLRRADVAEPTTASGRTGGEMACFAGWQLDLVRRQLYSPDGESVALTPGEYDLLLALLKNQGRVLGREQIDDAPGADEAQRDRRVYVRVMRLRRKLKPDPRAPKLIETVHKLGYKFVADVEWQ